MVQALFSEGPSLPPDNKSLLGGTSVGLRENSGDSGSRTEIAGGLGSQSTDNTE